MIKIKKLMSVVLAVTMIFSVFVIAPITTSAYTAHTQAEAIAWVQSQVGKSIDVDGAPAEQKYQCVDLIKAYYEYLGVGMRGGNAFDYAEQDYLVPEGWTRIQGGQPQPGDIIIYNPSASNLYCGHIAIYESDRVTYHQNFDGYTCVVRATYQYNRINDSYWGLIRPDFNVPKQGIDIGDDFYALILNEPSRKTIGQNEDCNVVVISEKSTTYDKTIWHFKKLNGNNAYKITSISNDRCIDVGDASAAEGANVWTYGFHNHEAQYWYYMLKGGKGTFMAGCSPMFLDLKGGSTADGTNVQMWSWNGSDAQQFTTYQITPAACNLDYNISVQDREIEEGGKTKITVGGTIPYVYNYKFHIVAPDGKETVVDNGCNPVLDFAPKQEGRYAVYAEIKNPYKTQKGSDIDRRVLVDVGCIHEYTEKFVVPDDDSKPYILYTCSLCGKSYKDNYMEYKDGWYYTDKVPESVKKTAKIEYNNYYEKIQKDSPGENWKKGDTVKNEWQNKGGQYDSYTELPVSDSRALVKECYYHWCIPGSSMGSEGNYEQTDKFNHYDEIPLPNEHVHVTWTGDDNGHAVYTLAWTDGNAVYCKSGEQCDGSWGEHDYRCRAWYKKYVYQDKEKIEQYKYFYESGWDNEADSGATKVTYRFSLEKDQQETPSETKPSESKETEKPNDNSTNPAATDPDDPGENAPTNPGSETDKAIEAPDTDPSTQKPTEAPKPTQVPEPTEAPNTTSGNYSVKLDSSGFAPKDGKDSVWYAYTWNASGNNKFVSGATEFKNLYENVIFLRVNADQKSSFEESLNSEHDNPWDSSALTHQSGDLTVKNGDTFIITGTEGTYGTATIKTGLKGVWKSDSVPSTEPTTEKPVIDPTDSSATKPVNDPTEYNNDDSDYSFEKLDNPLNAKGKTKKVKYSKVKKAKQTVKAIEVINYVGKLSYSKVSGSAKLSVNKTSGKITVKKKTKKGTYKIKVKITAKGDSGFKKGTKTVTVTIKVVR